MQIAKSLQRIQFNKTIWYARFLSERHQGFNVIDIKKTSKLINFRGENFCIKIFLIFGRCSYFTELRWKMEPIELRNQLTNKTPIQN